jgi:cytochrome c-type biogenesis protein CcmH/NrfG
MTIRTKSTAPEEAPAVERELLARLGLPAGASSQEVEAAHDDLVEYLEKAPTDLRAWSQREIAAIDEAYALLSDPTIDRAAIASIAAVAGAPAIPAPVARVASKRDAAAPPASTSQGRLLKRVAIAAAALVAVVAIAFAGYNLNGGTGVPSINGTPAPEASAATQVDPAQVAALMQKITANPKDVASLQSLADLYYQVSDFKTAGTFLDKIVAIDPKNLTALLALGAADFNQGDSVTAEKQWRAALAIDANNVEAHYDLGFMYLSESPPDVANVKLEWGKVIAIDPNSDVAKTVATHLASLDGSPAPSGAAPASGTPSDSPAPSASPAPAASPAASPSPSGN